MGKVKFVIASDINRRDGIGVELYLDSELQVEVFRDDTLKTRYVTLFKDNVELDHVEQCIAKFKQENLWDFIVEDGQE